MSQQILWFGLCPKILGAGRRIVEISTNEAVIFFNDGNHGKINLMKEFELAVGVHACECFGETDKQRIATSQLHLLHNSKETQKMKKMTDIWYRKFPDGRRWNLQCGSILNLYIKLNIVKISLFVRYGHTMFYYAFQ